MLKLNFVTPEKSLVVNRELEEILLPGFRGELDILNGHAPMLTTMEPGILKFKLKGDSFYSKYAISWGYCQVSTDSVNVLAETAIESSKVDLKVVKEHLKTYENRLMTETLDDQNYQDVTHEIDRLKAEIELTNLK